MLLAEIVSRGGHLGGVLSRRSPLFWASACRRKHDSKLSDEEKERVLSIMLDQMKSPGEMKGAVNKYVNKGTSDALETYVNAKEVAKLSMPMKDIRQSISIIGLPENHQALNLYLLKFISARDVEMCRQIYDKLKSMKRSLPFDAINNSTSIKFMTLLVEEEGVQSAIEFAKYFRNTFLIYRGGRTATTSSLEKLLTAALNVPGEEADVLLQAEALRDILLRTGNVHETFSALINPFVSYALKRHGWLAALKTFDRQQRLSRQFGGHIPLMQYIIDNLDKKGEELKAAFDLEPTADDAFCSIHVLIATVWRITERYNMPFGFFNAEFIVLLLRANRKEEAWMVSDHHPNIDDVKLRGAVFRLIHDFSTPDTKLIQDLIELLGRRSDFLKTSLRASPRLGLADAIRYWLISCHRKLDTAGAVAAIDAFKEHEIPIDDKTFALAIKVFEDAGMKPPNNLNPFPDRSKRRIRPIAITSMPELSPELEELVEEYKASTAEHFTQDPSALNVTNEHLILGAEIKQRCIAEGLNPRDRSRVMDELALASNCTRDTLYKQLKKLEKLQDTIRNSYSNDASDDVDRSSLAEVAPSKSK